MIPTKNTVYLQIPYRNRTRYGTGPSKLGECYHTVRIRLTALVIVPCTSLSTDGECAGSKPEQASVAFWPCIVDFGISKKRFRTRVILRGFRHIKAVVSGYASSPLKISSSHDTTDTHSVRHISLYCTVDSLISLHGVCNHPIQNRMLSHGTRCRTSRR